MSEGPSTPPHDEQLPPGPPMSGEAQQDEVIEREDSDNGESSSIDVVELERLEELSRDTTRRLHAVWDSMGLSQEERGRQLTSLVHSVEQVFVQKLADEVALKEQYINTSEALEEQITDLSKRLGLERRYFPHSNENLLMKIKWLRSHLDELEAVRKERLAKLEQQLSTLKSIWKQLGHEEELELLQLENFLSMDRMEEYGSRVTIAQNEKARRIAAIQEMIRDINALFDELEYEIVSETDKAIAQGGETLGIDMDAVDLLSTRARELTDEKISRTERLKQLGSQIQPLWERLEVDTESRQKFFMENRGLGKNVIRQCELELERLLELKQEKMGEFIEDARHKIRCLWDEMQYDEEQRSNFVESYMSAPICDETLDAHEEEINVLSIQAELYRPILRMIEKYYSLCDEREEYEQKIQDSSRLLSRKGGFALREEEQQRRRITKGIPTTMAKIRAAIEDYEHIHGPFMLSGERFVETMEANEKAHDEKLQEEKQRKQKAKKEDHVGVKYNTIGGTRTPNVKKSIAGTPGSSTPRSRAPLGNRNAAD